MEKISVACEIEITLLMIGGKYKPLILYRLGDNQPHRFGKLCAYIAHISQKTLTNQLRELERDGLISREVFAEVPPRVEYAITEKGMSLMPILELMCEWGYQHLDERYDVTSPQCF